MENFNSVTKSHYSPKNQEQLDEHKKAFELSANEWAGFKQWKEANRKVKKGAKGCKIFMVCDKKQKDEGGNQLKTDKGEDAKTQVVKSLYVFNIEHTEKI